MSGFPTTIRASEVRIGDVIKREYSPEYRQRPWAGLVVAVERAERPDGTELRMIRVRPADAAHRGDDHFMELDAPVIRDRSGFDEVWREGWPFQLGLQRCNLCQALVEDFSEQAHIDWHVSILTMIKSASMAHHDLSGGR